MKRTLFYAVSLFLLGGLSTHYIWASSLGTSAGTVLNIGVGARAIGMGEAYTAQSDDVSSLYWNPAGLSWMQQRQVSFTYNPWLEGLAYHNASLGIPLENGALGTSLSYLSLGSGKIDGYDITGNPIGDQRYYSAVGTVGASWLGGLWSLGFNAKGVQEALADVKATGFAFDLGGALIAPKPILDSTLRLGVVVQNLGTGITFLNQTDPFPTRWKVGLALVQVFHKRLNLSVDYAKPRDNAGSVYGGAEFCLGPYLAIRTGYAGTPAVGQGIRTGIGLHTKSLSFDYAYAGYGELGPTHRYELSFRFGEPRPILTPEERTILRQAKAAMRDGRYEKAVLLFNSLVELEPHYKPARRLIVLALNRLQHRDTQMVRTDFRLPVSGHTSVPDAETEELKLLLDISLPAVAQKTGTEAGLLEVKQQ